MKTNVRIQRNNLSINTVKIYMSAFVFIVFYGCSGKTDFIVTDSGLQYKVVKDGSGPIVENGQEVLIHETTKYTNDSIVYTSRNREEPLKILVGGNQVIKGVDEGLLGMKKGEIRKLIVPPSLSKRMGKVTFPHPDSTLLYDIELIGIVEKKIASEITNGNILKIDKENSTLRWEGFNKLHTSGHYGTVDFISGEFFKEKDRITGGEFIINMNTIANIDGGYSEMLVDHLKNSDFFDTEKFPVAKLSIVNIDYKDDSNALITADLTIRDVKQLVEFEASITYNDGKLSFISKFIIDRIRWNITYASGSIFDNLKDNLISDEIHFEVKLLTE
ncbi:FKBP-type peptidyl-prolyl cis-trans isomerase [Aquimarina amphilecti]|uniref:peptidylprolyl isomerase n=1 Tax=Aquimarina amphilecti TaxID=1038014 RepID=A0A1H7HP16_AQUAM|nr:YceI family protein [Aquimarina amphilecti]SEK51222.1 FKBP-type peptidyl-prolyl cis-trans isomerase [Aquimarina amphilecti]